MQIRTRLTLQFMLIVASILLAAVSYIYFQSAAQLENEFFGNLRSKAYLTASVAVGRLETQAVTEISTTTNRPASAQFYNENVSIFDPQNRLVYSFQPSGFDFSMEKIEQIRQSGETKFIAGKMEALGVQFFSPSGKIFVVIAEANFDDSNLNELLRLLVIVFFVLLFIAAAAGWAFAGRALAPVNQIMNQVEAILPSDLSRRVSAQKQHDELGRLTTTFNQLLDRVEKAFTAQKMFISNISHELKNPLTIITTQLEVALGKERSPADYQKTLQSVLDDARELNVVSEKLMQLAKVNAAASPVNFSEIRLDETIWQVKSALLKANPDFKIHFELGDLPDDESQLSVRGNEQLLKSALQNLIENACKFSPDHTAKIKMFFEKKLAVIEIADAGPGIPPEDLPMIFEPFFRGRQTSGVRGSGVGLSLVKSVLDLHGVKIEVKKNEPWGTVFRLGFS